MLMLLLRIDCQIGRIDDSTTGDLLRWQLLLNNGLLLTIGGSSNTGRLMIEIRLSGQDIVAINVG